MKKQKSYTLTEAIKYIQELENKVEEVEKIRAVFEKLKYGEIDEFDFSDQVIEIMGSASS